MATGMRTPYTDSNRKKILVAKAVDMIDWTEAPVLKLLGTDNASKFGIPEVGTKYEWNTDTMSPRSGTVNEAVDNSETEITVAAGNGDYLKAGDVIKIDSELIWVGAVASSTSLDPVIRGWAGTTAATHSSGTAWTLETSSSISGSDAITGHTTTMNRVVNYTATLKEAVKVAGDESNDPSYDGQDTLVYHLGKLLGENGKAGKLPILLEGIFRNGITADAGSATAARACIGVPGFVTSHVTAMSGAALTRTNIEDTFAACFESGGSPDTIICGAHARRKISTFYEKYIYTERSEERGGSKITTVVTDFGDMEVMYWRWCPPNVLYIIEKNEMGWITKRPWQVIDLPAPGDYEWKDVLGEFGFVVRNEAAHGIISGFSTVA